MFYFLQHIELEKEEPRTVERKEGTIDLFASQRNYLSEGFQHILPTDKKDGK